MVTVIRMRNYAVLPLVILQVSFILAIIFLIAIKHLQQAFLIIRKCSCIVQEGFLRFGNGLASCRATSHNLEMTLQAAGRLPKV